MAWKVKDYGIWLSVRISGAGVAGVQRKHAAVRLREFEQASVSKLGFRGQLKDLGNCTLTGLWSTILQYFFSERNPYEINVYTFFSLVT